MNEAFRAESGAADLLIEIGCEDLPAGSIVPLAEHLGRELQAALAKAGLAASENAPATFATPRRIAARWPMVAARQPDREVERKGPAVAAAYGSDGAPTKALEGFLRSASASVDDLSTVETPKGAWVVLRRTEVGSTLAEVLGETLPAVVASMPMPRRMRWGDGEAEFLRPVVWLLALHGQEVLPLELFGLKADRTTRGHRFHAPEPIALDDPSTYEGALERARVVADFAGRRERVLAGVRAEVARVEREEVGTATHWPSVTRPFAARLDPALVDEVTALVEWPVALAGTFDTGFLGLPDEALIQTMEENQRYFAVQDADGVLLDVFVTVANIESTNPATVIDGNERVIRPRFADTMFFWKQDEWKQEVEGQGGRVPRSLADFRPELDRVLFQQKLGSLGDKVRRLEALVAAIGPAFELNEEDTRQAVLAASLCKCDLVSAIVEELPKMQGIAGRHYAARDARRMAEGRHGRDGDAGGYSIAVQSAMESHYYPKQAGGPLPTNSIGHALAVADKLDTLVGVYGQGLVPSGAKDPFGLRRAALGIVRILLEDYPLDSLSDGRAMETLADGAYDIDLAVLVAASARTYAGRLDGIDEGAIVAYVLERLRGWLVERGASPDAVDAVLAKGLSNPSDIVARLEAIERFRATEAAPVLAAASKRIANILRKADGAVPDAIDPDALVEPAERALAEALDAARPGIEARFAARDYAGAMTSTATLREPVDAFFDAVMVMDEDARLRANRLALLARVEALCSFTAKLSRLDARGDAAA